MALDEGFSFNSGIFAFEASHGKGSVTSSEMLAAGLQSVAACFERLEKVKDSLRIVKFTLVVSARIVGNFGLMIRTQPPTNYVDKDFTSARELRKWLNTPEGRAVGSNFTWRLHFER